MSKIESKSKTIIDTMNKIHKEGNNIVCCGGLLEMTCHIDGTDFYSTQYQCECGNVINVNTKRSKSDMMRWK